MEINVKPKEATAIINSLIGGVVPKIGVQHITVGRSNEVEMVLSALEETKNGHSMMKFWIGDYGSGKSFMLHLLTTVALKQKFVVASADFTPHIRLYSNDGKGQALYTALMNNVAIQTKPEGGALHILLEKWIEQVIVSTAEKNRISLIEIRARRHFGLIQDEIMKTINSLTETGGFDFGLAVIKYYEGFIENNDSLRKDALRWLKGEYANKTEARRDLGVSEIVNDRNYYDMLKNFCRLFTSIGYSGLVVNLDEAVNLFKIPNPGMRQRNYEKLLSIYNDCFQGKVEHLFFNVAGTMETLEDEKKGFYSYDALKTRLQINRYETQQRRDYSQPVIRLMPLSHDEIFVLLYNLRTIFNFNYKCEVDFSDPDIHAFMEEIYNKPGATEFLTPREVIRDFLNVLNILRQNPQVNKQSLFDEIKIEERADEHEMNVESEEDIRLKKIKKIEKQLKNVLLPPEVLDELSHILLDDESPLKTISASFNNEAGTLMATEKRLLFISKRKTVKSFPYGQINEMAYKSGPQYSTLHIQLNTEKLNIDFIPNSRIKPLINLLEAQIDIIERKTLAAELKYWEKEIDDQGMKAKLNRMSRIAYMIQEKDHTAGEVFSMRHNDTVIKLLQQLKAIEVSEVTSVEVTESRERIIEALNVTKEAFENELANMLQADMLDIDAETMAYKQNLKNRGLINE